MQLSFPIINKGEQFDKASFIDITENAEAKNFLFNFAKNNYLVSDYDAHLHHNMILQGPRCCGKTHLLSILSDEYSAKFLTLGQINNLEFLATLPKKKIYIVEDLDQIDDDEVVLRLINFAREAKIFLIFSLVDFDKFKLPDLISRLKTIPIAKIENLSEQSIKEFFTAILINYNIALSQSKIDFIIKNCQRNYKTVIFTSQKIAEFYDEFLRQPSLNEIKEIIF